MNKVVTINLNGQAFQLEEKAYASLKAYLQSARTELADDPDKEEIMQDFEQAIAEKCHNLLTDHKNVISTAEVESIINAMGEVEVTAPGHDSHSKAHADHKSSQSDSTPKRLYILREGGIIGGVCSGLAAYLNTDVTIVRLAFIVLTFITGGIMVLIYLLMMLVVPEATTPEQKAELRGERFTAQDVIDRAKQKYADLSTTEHWREVSKNSAPMLHSAGHVITQILRVLYVLCAIITGVIIAALSCAWIAAIWYLAGGNLHLTDQLSTISPWAIAVATTCTYLITILPVIAIMRILISLARGRKMQRRDGRWFIIIAVLWVIASGILGGMSIAYSARINAYEQKHGYIIINDHHICVNSDLCGDAGQYETPLQLDKNPPNMRYIPN